jgi:HEAT repeat protein
MSFYRNGSILKVISCALIVTFLTLNVSWAATLDRGGAFNSDLSAQSPFQGQMMTDQAELFRQSILADIDLMTVVFSVAKCLLGDPENGTKPLSIKYLETTVTEEFGKPIENVNLSNISIKDDVILIPYEKEGKKYVIQIALNDKAHPEKLAGYEWVISDKYLVKVLPEDYTEIEEDPTEIAKEQKVVVSEPITAMWADTPETNEEAEPQKKSFSIRAILRGKILGVDPFSMSGAVLAVGWASSQVLDIIKEYPIPTAIAGAIIGIIVLVKLKNIYSRIFSPVKYYIRELHSGKEKRVRKAKSALEGLGKPAISALANLVKNKNETSDIKVLAIDILGEIDDKRAVDHLIKMLNTSNPYVISRCAETLGKIKNPKAVEPLIKLIDISHTNYAEAVHKALISIGEPAVDPLITLSRSDEGMHAGVLRIQAIDMLGQIGSRKSVPRILQVVESENTDERISAIRALGRIADSEGIAALKANVDSDDEKVAIAALQALYDAKKINDEKALKVLIRIFGKTYSKNAIELIGKVFGEKIGKHLLDIVKSAEYKKYPTAPVLEDIVCEIDTLSDDEIDLLFRCLTEKIQFELVIISAKTRVEEGVKFYKSGAHEVLPQTYMDTPAHINIKVDESEISRRPVKSTLRITSKRAKWDDPADSVTTKTRAEESQENNVRTKFVNVANRLLAALTADSKIPGKVIIPLDRNDSTTKIMMRARDLLQIASKLSPPSVTDNVYREVNFVREQLPQFEVHSLIEAIILKARQAEREGQSLVIGLDTSWIPELEKEGSLQHNALSPLMKEIYSLGSTLKDIGLDNVVIVHESSAKLAGEILLECEEKHTDLSNVVVLAANGTIESAAFNALKSTSTEKKAFLAGVDAAALDEFITGKGVGLEELNINILEMLTLTLELASGKDAPEVPLIQSYDKANRIVILFPRAEALDYQKLREEYKMRREFLQAA